jgi:hypothetical protein
MYRILIGKLVLLLSLLAIGSLNSTAQKFCKHLRLAQQTAMNNTVDLRADTFDVLNYEINAKFLDYQTNKDIDASCQLTIVQKMAASSVNLDLLGLNVSAVEVNGVPASFSYSSPSLKVNLSTQIDDTLKLLVHYDGNPVKDPQWGGFYFTGEYAFNMGVGFASDPHNFGRVWFPCFDNFVDRATYIMNISVNAGIKAYGNGLLVSKTDTGAVHTYSWEMTDPIPTYLAAVAIAAYEEVKMEVDGIPVILTALKADTANVRSSFENLPACIRQFVSSYGTHSFDRIGFNVVPFNAGAMEHATNIAYPFYAINGGGKQSETLFAHELAHHWWGNTITCNSQEEMWLNEGWASFSESLFLEAVYGRTRYNSSVETNHRDVLQFAHVRDGASLPVSGIGHANTYGNHVYNKGADMVHTLRGFMGDDNFFEACRTFQETFKFKDVSTDDMKTHFQNYSSVNLSSFFDQWIKTKGFAHFDIHWIIEQGGSTQINVKQTPRFNELEYKDVPVMISGFSSSFQRFDSTVILSQKEQTFAIKAPFDVVFWSLDYDDLISDALTSSNLIAKSAGSFNLKQDGLMDLVVDSVPAGDSIVLRIEHHWAGADATYGAPSGVTISRQRYWNVDGIWPTGSKMSASLTYSGIKTSGSPEYGYLDNELIRITEDSLVLLYRPSGNKAWVVYDDYNKIMGSAFDKRGSVLINNLEKGQYTFGMYDSNLANQKELPKPHSKFKVFPNPVEDELTIEFESAHDCCVLEITNALGQVVKSKKIRAKRATQTIDVSDLKPGNYFVGLVTDNLGYDIRRIVIK